MMMSLTRVNPSGKAVGEADEVVERLTYLEERRKIARHLKYNGAVAELKPVQRSDIAEV
jgi:hypothetical protein